MRKEISKRIAGWVRMIPAGGVCGMLLLGSALSGWAQTTELPEGKGKEIVQTVCTQCHGLSSVVSSRMTPEDWKNTVYDMVSRGAPLLEEEMDVVAQYLTANFGKQATGKINVNKATVKDLETSLQLSADEAKEVISYRSKNGNFAKLEDLQKVPGLDIKKLEAMKDRLEF